MNYTKTKHGDVNIYYPNDCGNAPKKVILRDFTIATATNDENYISEMIDDKLLWKFVGHQHVQGKEKVIQFLREAMSKEVSELDIHMIITHGKTASLNGRLTLKNKKIYDFCHVYLFTSAGKNAKLKEITSYMIETSK